MRTAKVLLEPDAAKHLATKIRRKLRHTHGALGIDALRAVETVVATYLRSRPSRHRSLEQTLRASVRAARRSGRNAGGSRRYNGSSAGAGRRRSHAARRA